MKTTATSAYLNTEIRPESAVRAERAANAFLPDFPEAPTGHQETDAELRELFEECQRFGRGNAKTLHALRVWGCSANWRDKNLCWAGNPSKEQIAKARNYVATLTGLAREPAQ